MGWVSEFWQSNKKNKKSDIAMGGSRNKVTQCDILCTDAKEEKWLTRLFRGNEEQLKKQQKQKKPRIVSNKN